MADADELFGYPHVPAFDFFLPEAEWQALQQNAVDGGALAYSVNADGFSELYLRRMASGASRRLAEIGAGVISGLRFQGRKSLAFPMSTATTPMDVYAYDFELRRLDPASEPAEAVSP
jgi:hypothetical protein